MSEFLVVLYIMPQRVSFKGDWGKAPIYAMSHRDSSSDDEIVSASDRMARVLQSHFDHEGNDIRPIGRIPMESRSRRQRSTEKLMLPLSLALFLLGLPHGTCQFWRGPARVE